MTHCFTLRKTKISLKAVLYHYSLVGSQKLLTCTSRKQMR